MVDDLGGNVTQLAVFPLGGADQQPESLLRGTAAAGHQDADRMLDDGAGAHRPLQPLGGLAGIPVSLYVGQLDRGRDGEVLGPQDSLSGKRAGIGIQGERLGFTQEWEHRIEPDWPAFVSIARGRARLFLSEHRGDARPDTLVGLFVSDIAPVLAEFGPPADERPYRCEIELRDPDGNRLRISTASG